MPRDDSESLATAATRAWLRIPRTTRRKFTSKDERLPDEIWSSLLFLLVREVAPELNGVVRHALRGRLTAEEAERLETAIVGEYARLDRAGDWVQGMKAARNVLKRRGTAGESTPPLSALYHRAFRAAWERSAVDRDVDEDECMLLVESFTHADFTAPPPTHAAFKALFADPEEVRALDEILAAFTAPEGDVTEDREGVRDLEAALLNASISADWARLWSAYTAVRPWVRHLTAVHATGLSRRAVPGRPRVLDDGPDGKPDAAGNRRPDDRKDTGARSAESPTAPDGDPEPEAEHDWAGEIFGHSESTVLPLDRSIWRRLDHTVRNLDRHPTARKLTAREVARDEARRALEPLGLADDEGRAVLCLALACLVAISADHSDAIVNGGRPLPRLLRQLADLTQKQVFVGTSYRLGAEQHAPVRRALDDPVPGCARMLWKMLHSGEIRCADPVAPEERWGHFVVSAARRYLRVLRGELCLVLDGRKPIDAEVRMPGTGQELEDAVNRFAAHDTSSAGFRDSVPPLVETVADVVIEVHAQRGISGDELAEWVERFIDPLFHGWARTAWDDLYADYPLKHREPYGPYGSAEFPPIAFDTARDIVRSLYRPAARDGVIR